MEITVRVQNYAKVFRATLKQVRTLATDVFRHAGTEPVGLDCAPFLAAGHAQHTVRQIQTETKAAIPG